MAKCRCNRCEHVWISEVEQPKRCAGCRSTLWNRERVYKLKEKPNLKPKAHRRPRKVKREIFEGYSASELIYFLYQIEELFRSALPEISEPLDTQETRSKSATLHAPKSPRPPRFQVIKKIIQQMEQQILAGK